MDRYGPVPAERSIHLLRQVCHSLAEAEARGLVHRDIKPANIFVCRYGGDVDFVKVLDFGIVKAADTAPSAMRTLATSDDPAERPQTARELARRLAAVPAPAVWSEERARQWWSTHRPEAAADR